MRDYFCLEHLILFAITLHGHPVSQNSKLNFCIQLLTNISHIWCVDFFKYFFYLVQHKKAWNDKNLIDQALTAGGGDCFNWRMMERILETSLDVLDDFGLKSHSFEILSHSVPGSTSSASATNCFSAFLCNSINWRYKMQY